MSTRFARCQELVSNEPNEWLTPTADAIFIGPNDLAMSLLNYAPARYDEPIFLRALDKITEAAKRHGKYVGILVSDGDAGENGCEALQHRCRRR